MDTRWVILGRVSGLYGVKGWVKIFSHTEPRQSIIDYDPLYLQRADGWQIYKVSTGRTQGKGVVVHFEGIDDRDVAATLVGSMIAIDRHQLPTTADDEYYWTDLEGLQVMTVEGVNLGTVSHLIETGANDVLVIVGERERLVPFIRDSVIKHVDLAQGIITVDWQPDF